MNRGIYLILTLSCLVLLVSCSKYGDQPSQSSEHPVSAPQYFGAGSEFVELEEITAQSISAQSTGEGFPDLNDTQGKRVSFKYEFSDSEKISFTVRDGLVASGDMILATYDELIETIEALEDELAATPASNELASQAAITKRFCKFRTFFCWDTDGSKWKNGIIYYEPPSTRDFPQSTINMIYDVMREIERNTDIDFQVAGSGGLFTNRIHFTSKNDGCYTWLGMAGGRQQVNLAPYDPVEQTSCQTLRVIRHELGHVMGMIHEHQRPDRDSYVRINTGNIESGQGDQFDRWRKSLAVRTDYDYDSVMHYRENSFSNGRGPTIEALNGRTGLGGNVYTQDDIDAINRRY